MAEIEDERRPLGRAQDSIHGPVQGIAAGDQRYGIEIALYYGARSESLRRPSHRCGRIHADRVDARFGRIGFVAGLGRSAWETDDRRVWKRAANRSNDTFVRGDDPIGEFLRR